MWNRTLIFAEPAVDAAPPMWDRPSQSGGKLISLDPVSTTHPMWHRPLAHAGDAVPIFEEAVVSPSQMWHRTPTGIPVCPCCTTPATVHMQSSASATWSPTTMRSLDQRRSSESAFSVSTTSSGSNTSRLHWLQHRTSSLSLRIKQSFARLRKRSSVEPL